MRPDGDNGAVAFVLSLALHVLLVAVAWLSSQWIWREPEPAQGEPIGATLRLSAADLRRAEQAVAAAEKVRPPEPPSDATPQPLPEPTPQTADTPLQTKPQEQLDKPDTVEQEQVVRNAIEPSEAQVEQERRQRQDQVELTPDIATQQEAERLQHLREQMEAIRVQRAEANKVTRMEEQRLAQLADRAAATPTPARATRPSPPSAGAQGADAGLRGRYHAAMLATAKSNWTSRGLAPEAVKCTVSFVQIPGGDVINIEFMNCPYDVQGRESIERALHMTPMPYSGFETVFERKVTLDFCYPDEACPQ